jgi:hypothetical protein
MFPIFKKVGIKKKDRERNIPTVHYPRKGRKREGKESTRRLHRHREQTGSFFEAKGRN